MQAARRHKQLFWLSYTFFRVQTKRFQQCGLVGEHAPLQFVKHILMRFLLCVFVQKTSLRRIHSPGRTVFIWSTFFLPKSEHKLPMPRSQAALNVATPRAKTLPGSAKHLGNREFWWYQFSMEHIPLNVYRGCSDAVGDNYFSLAMASDLQERFRNKQLSNHPPG